MIPFVVSPPCDAVPAVPGKASSAAGGGAGQWSTKGDQATPADDGIPFSFLAWVDRCLAETLAAVPGAEGSLALQHCPTAMDGLPTDTLGPLPAGWPAAGVPDVPFELESPYGSHVAEVQTPLSSGLSDSNGGVGLPASWKQNASVIVPWRAADPMAANGPTAQGPQAKGPAAMGLATAPADPPQPDGLLPGQPGQNLAAQTTLLGTAPRAGVDTPPSVAPEVVVPESKPTAESSLPAHSPTRQRAAFGAAPTAAAHGQAAEVGEALHVQGQLSGVMMAEAGRPPHPLRRQSDRFEAQLDGAQTVALRAADSETRSTSADPAGADARRHASPEQPFEMVDRSRQDANNRAAASGAGGSAAEAYQPNRWPENGKSAAVGLQSTAADNQLLSTSGSPDKTDTASVRAFQATVMDQVVGKAALRTINGRSEIQIHLKPDFLGSVQMTVAGDKDQMMVRILTDQPLVKEIIETHLHQLKAELHHQGLTIERFEVMVKPDVDQQPNRDSFAHNMNQQSSQHGRRHEREQNPENPAREAPGRAMEERPQRSGIDYFA
jgi:hypothetical protein